MKKQLLGANRSLNGAWHGVETAPPLRKSLHLIPDLVNMYLPLITRIWVSTPAPFCFRVS